MTSLEQAPRKRPTATAHERLRDENKKKGFIEGSLDRFPRGKRVAAALLALGIQAPLRGETIQKETETTVAAEAPTLEEAVNQVQESHFDLRTMDDGRVALIVESGLEPASGLELGSMQRMEYDPGVTTTGDYTMQMDWAGRSFEHGAQPKEGVREKAMAQARTRAESLLQKFTEMGIDANTVIERVTVHSVGSSSAEGPTAENEAAAEQRGELGARSLGQALLESGIDKDKIEISWEGTGEQGSLEEFGNALTAAGVDGTNPEQVLRSIHDGKETRPEVLAAYQKHIAGHRSAHIRVEIEQVPVDIYVQPGQEKAAEVLTRVLKEWGRHEEHSGPEQDVEVEQHPLPGGVPPDEKRAGDGTSATDTGSEPPMPPGASDSRTGIRGGEGVPIRETGSIPITEGIPPTGDNPLPPPIEPIKGGGGTVHVDPTPPGGEGIEILPPTKTRRTTGETVDVPPPPSPPYEKSLRTALDDKPLPPKSRTPQQRQYATGLGSAKGQSIGRAPSRQASKDSARKHHTGKR